MDRGVSDDNKIFNVEYHAIESLDVDDIWSQKNTASLPYGACRK